MERASNFYAPKIIPKDCPEVRVERAYTNRGPFAEPEESGGNA